MVRMLLSCADVRPTNWQGRYRSSCVTSRLKYCNKKSLTHLRHPSVSAIIGMTVRGSAATRRPTRSSSG